MKRISKILILMSALVLCLAVFAGCGGVKSISFEKGESPRSTYVVGQDLDLSSGTLTVRQKNSTEKIPLTSSGVSVSGYDKDKVGSQKVTISYKGAEVVLNVTVIARVSFSGVETNYLVGEPFDRTKGKVKIANDDATTFDVDFSDERITIEGFDSSKEGSCSVSVRYQDGDKNYSGSFQANVSAVTNVSFTAPRKNAYFSHETELDLSGGSFKVEYGAGKSKFIDITPDAVSGYDPSKATEANETTPLEQELTAVYAGQEFKFKITIYYSAVSLMRDRAKELSSLDWSKSTPPQISDEAGERAMEAVEKFLDLKASDREYLSFEDLQCVVRVASVYGVQKFEAEMEEFKNTLKSDRDGLHISSSSYSQTSSDVQKLRDKNQEIYSYTELLYKIKTELSYVPLYGRTTVEERLAFVFDPAELEHTVKKLELLVSLQTISNKIDTNWSDTMLGGTPNLTRYGTDIDNALSQIVVSKLTSFEDRDIYRTLSSWRSKNDFFDILYTYYWNLGTDDGMNAINDLKNIYLPGPLEELYESIYLAYGAMNSALESEVGDTTQFFTYFERAVKAEAEVLKSKNTLYINLLEELTYNDFLVVDGDPYDASFSLLMVCLRVDNNSYYSLLGNVLGDKKVAELWDKYLLLYGKMIQEPTYVDTDEFGNSVKELMKLYTSLTPSHQLGFLESLNPGYAEGSPETAFGAASTEKTSYFTYFLDLFYRSELSERAYEVYQDLMLATELYAKRYYELTPQQEAAEGNYEARFVAKMAKTKSEYDALGGSDKSKFDSLLKDVYDDYIGVYNRYDPSFTVPALGTEWAPKFAKIAQLTQYTQTIGTLITMIQMYEVELSFFEKIDELENEILTEAPDFVREYYLYGAYPVLDEIEGETLEYSVYYIRRYYLDSFWRIAQDLNMDVQDRLTDNIRDLYLSAFDMFYDYYELGYERIDQENIFKNVDGIEETMKKFRALSNEEKATVLILDSYLGEYHASIDLFCKVYLPGYAYNVGSYLIDVEKTYVVYVNDLDSASYARFQAAWEKFQEEYKTLFDENKDTFEKYMGEMREYYEGEYNRITNADKS